MIMIGPNKFIKPQKPQYKLNKRRYTVQKLKVGFVRFSSDFTFFTCPLFEFYFFKLSVL